MVKATASFRWKFLYGCHNSIEENCRKKVYAYDIVIEDNREKRLFYSDVSTKLARDGEFVNIKTT